jgi:hypothetical protein
MAKVITFSRTFPAYHPKKGQPTYFVEKFLTAINDKFFLSLNHGYTPKYHTIRPGKRFKYGEYFSPRFWGNNINEKSGRSGPYHSDQIIIAQDIKIEGVFDFKMDLEGTFFLNGNWIDVTSSEIPTNDGFECSDDMLGWFPYGKQEFNGQVICWDKNTCEYLSNYHNFLKVRDKVM